MPRFPVAFGRRRSTVTPDDFQNGQIAAPSFRVLERSEVVGGKSFDGGVRLARASHSFPQPVVHEIAMEENMFADLKTNRYVELIPRLPPYVAALLCPWQEGLATGLHWLRSRCGCQTSFTWPVSPLDLKLTDSAIGEVGRPTPLRQHRPTRRPGIATSLPRHPPPTWEANKVYRKKIGED
jgi:hypothetical protein